MSASPRPGPEHRALAPFVGVWSTAGQVLATASSPAQEIAGTDAYEWIPGGFFLLHTVDVRIGGERAQALEVIGWDAANDAYFMRSFDSQGNEEVMRATLRDGTWTFLGSESRFSGGFGDGGRTLSGRWERRQDGQWLPWMDVHLTKRHGDEKDATDE